MNRHFINLARRVHRFGFLRNVAKRIAGGRTIALPFHSGIICVDAVEHSWAWTGNRKLTEFEGFLQDRLLQLTATRDTFIDIGCNIGVMTLSVLLRRPNVTSISIDPNHRALELLADSLKRNGLSSRARTIGAAVSNDTRTLAYDAEGSFVGHVVPAGVSVPAIPLVEFLAQHVTAKAVVKIDVEGYEAMLVESLQRLPRLPGSVLAIELHPLGFNGWGDPHKVIAALRSRGDLGLRFIGDEQIESFDPTQFHQLEATWANE
jgi:FkbM family methyltransferase